MKICQYDAKSAALNLFRKNLLSFSAHSHDEPQAGPSRLLHRASTSVEHHLPPVPDANEGSILKLSFT